MLFTSKKLSEPNLDKGTLMKNREKQVLEKLIAWGNESADVRAMILTSTRATPHATPDAFSDFDVILAARDIHRFAHDDRWLDTFGRVLVMYRDPIQLEDGYERFFRVVQYEDERLKIDFAVRPVELIRAYAAKASLPEELDVGYKILLDKDGVTNGLKPPTYRAFIPAIPTEQEYLCLVEEFFHEATYTAKHLWRGDIFAAKESLDHAVKFRNLRRMLEWQIETKHAWSLKTGDSAKGLQRYLPQSVRAQLEATYVGCDIKSNWDALFATITLFRAVAIDVADCLDYRYPEALHDRVVKYLRQAQALPHSIVKENLR